MTREVTTCDICGEEIYEPTFRYHTGDHFYKYTAYIDIDYNGNKRIKHRKTKMDTCKNCFEKFKEYVKENGQ